MVSQSFPNEGSQSATSATPELLSQTLSTPEPLQRRPLQRQPFVKQEPDPEKSPQKCQGAPQQRKSVQWTSFKSGSQKKSGSANSGSRERHSNPQDNSTSLPKGAIAVDALAQLPGSIVLPPFRSQTSISQRHEVNPAMAINLLQDLQSIIVTWQKQLRQLVAALHSLHAQGPMVEGWIESSADVSPISGPDATLLRHGDTDAIMRYIETLADQPQVDDAETLGLEIAPDVPLSNELLGSQPFDSESSSPSINSAAPTQYRLCSLDENGQLRSHPCPPEQMGALSLAIARYQKFKQLMGQKQTLDAKLQKAVDQLTGIRAMLQQEE